MTSDIAWHQAIAAIEEHDPWTRGILVLGLDAPEADLAASFRVVARHSLVKGFAVGRTLFGETARAFLAGRCGEDAALADMAARYARMAALWDAALAEARREAPQGAQSQPPATPTIHQHGEA